MPITNTWYDDENAIILQRIVDPWAWEDFENAVQQAYQMRRQQGGRRHYLIVDFSASSELPPLAIRHFEREIQEIPADPGDYTARVYVAMPPVMRVIHNLLNREHPERIRTTYDAASVDEAIRLITSLRVE